MVSTVKCATCLAGRLYRRLLPAVAFTLVSVRSTACIKEGFYPE